MDWLQALTPIIVFLLCWEAGRPVLFWLKRQAILDHPVERSSHQIPVPRGGGLSVVPIVLIAWLALSLSHHAPPEAATIALLAMILMAVSWLDDLWGIPIGIRLVVHVAAAAVGVAFLPDNVFQGLVSPLLDRMIALWLWVWFVNLFNFMDGIDGISGSETGAIGIGMALVLLSQGLASDGTATLSLSIAAGGLAFLRWNWHPAKIFLGDVGSVPLGFLLGWLLFRLAAEGFWASALILPLYYLADATLTLARRALGGERFWQAHRQHFYQRALAPGGDHAAVMRLLIVENVILVILAVLGSRYPAPALAVAIITVATLLFLLERRARQIVSR